MDDESEEVIRQDYEEDGSSSSVGNQEECQEVDEEDDYDNQFDTTLDEDEFEEEENNSCNNNNEEEGQKQYFSDNSNRSYTSIQNSYKSNSSLNSEASEILYNSESNYSSTSSKNSSELDEPPSKIPKKDSIGYFTNIEIESYLKKRGYKDNFSTPFNILISKEEVAKELTFGLNSNSNSFIYGPIYEEPFVIYEIKRLWKFYQSMKKKNHNMSLELKELLIPTFVYFYQEFYNSGSLNSAQKLYEEFNEKLRNEDKSKENLLKTIEIYNNTNSQNIQITDRSKLYIEYPKTFVLSDACFKKLKLFLINSKQPALIHLFSNNFDIKILETLDLDKSLQNQIVKKVETVESEIKSEVDYCLEHLRNSVLANIPNILVYTTNKNPISAASSPEGQLIAYGLNDGGVKVCFSNSATDFYKTALKKRAHNSTENGKKVDSNLLNNTENKESNILKNDSSTNNIEDESKENIDKIQYNADGEIDIKNEQIDLTDNSITISIIDQELIVPKIEENSMEETIKQGNISENEELEKDLESELSKSGDGVVDYDKIPLEYTNGNLNIDNFYNLGKLDNLKDITDLNEFTDFNEMEDQSPMISKLSDFEEIPNLNHTNKLTETSNVNNEAVENVEDESNEEKKENGKINDLFGNEIGNNIQVEKKLTGDEENLKFKSFYKNRMTNSYKNWSSKGKCEDSEESSSEDEGDIDKDDLENNSKEILDSVIIGGHQGNVYDLTFHPFAKLLYTVGEDTEMRLWDLSKFNNINCISNYRGHLGPIWSVNVSQTGNFIATGSLDTTTQIWIPERTASVRVLVGHHLDVECVRFHPNEAYVATCSNDKTARLWSIDDGNIVRLFTGFSSSVTSIVMHESGKYIIGGGEEEKLIIWDIGKGEILHEIPSPSGHCRDLKLNGNILAGLFEPNKLVIWNLQSILGGTPSSLSFFDENLESLSSNIPLPSVFNIEANSIFKLHYKDPSTLLLLGEDSKNKWFMHNKRIVPYKPDFKKKSLKYLFNNRTQSELGMENGIEDEGLLIDNNSDESGNDQRKFQIHRLTEEYEQDQDDIEKHLRAVNEVFEDYDFGEGEVQEEENEEAEGEEETTMKNSPSDSDKYLL